MKNIFKIGKVNKPIHLSNSEWNELAVATTKLIESKKIKDMRNYDEIITKLMSGILQMEQFVVESGEPLYVRDGVREILRRIEKLDEYMSYGADSQMYKEMAPKKPTPLIEGRTKSNIKNNTQTRRLAPPPPKDRLIKEGAMPPKPKSDKK